MAKTRFFRVAVEGATTDGRSIERQWLLDAAETYNRDTYAARVNLEHVRGITPDGPFQAYGDILALKTEEITLDVGGKQEKRLALFAEIDALEPLVAMNKKNQKLYSSIEISPNFANTGKAYLVGMAVTDSPASLGTEMLQFAAQAKENPLAHRKQDKANLFTAAEETAIELADEAPAGQPASEVPGLLSSIKGLLEKMTGKPAVHEPVTPPAPAAGADTGDAAQFAAFGEILTRMTGAVEKVVGEFATVSASVTALSTRVEKVEKVFEHTPANQFQHQQRQPATGGAGNVIKTDC